MPLSTRAAVTVLAGLLIGLSACSSSDKGNAKGSDDSSSSASRSASSTVLSKDDAYDIGCPAVDTALGAGSLARRAAGAALGKLADDTQLSPDAKGWLDDARQLLSASKPDDVPGSVRNRVKKACADHGHQLDNL